MWIRFIFIGFFSLTAITLWGYQIIEIIHAYSDTFFHKN